MFYIFANLKAEKVFDIKTKSVLAVVLLTLFVVSLTASAVSASATIYSKPLTSSPGGPVVKFFAYVPQKNAPSEVQFYDQSSGGYWKYWSFGDGTGSNSRLNAIYHTYSKPRTYKVTLKETNFIGTKSNYAYLTITIQ